MKKLLTFALVIALVFALAFSVHATELETPEETPDINDSVTVSETEEKGIIDTIMNSTVWASIGSFVLMAGGVLIYVSKKFGGLIALVRNKADDTTIKAYITESKSNFNELSEKIANSEKTDAETQDAIKNIMAILSMYIMNDSKYNANAKAEIMKYITGIKEFTGTVAEICEKATEEITKANEAEIKEETPALDSIVNGIALD